MSRFNYRPGDDSLLLGGHPLSYWSCFIGPDGITVEAAEPRLTRTSIPGRHGLLDQTLRDRKGRAYDDKGRDITVDIVMTADELDQRKLRQRLGEYQGMRTSIWWQRMWDGEYRGTLQIGEWKDVILPGMRYLCTGTTLTLSADDSVQHGPRERLALNEGRNQLGIKGNRLAMPTLDLTTKNVTEISVNDGANTLRFTQETAFAAGRALAVDSEQGTATLDGTPLAPTLDSDYPELASPQTTITLTGCDGWIEYEPLYFI
ncbi:hypothetical protein JS533_006600 [Bifidobacterium amazonense]|uniref:Siphovirus-type tail component C-terminal domain-containing protein n=1 Tax=Bifidobacterium amazonense TaxID=2809027 RepID=A0ABS9VV05_9BIFI|nr:hypothetical protein [Bifidobacterium amazonense]MCH9275941.1 hypothetical protein [Bifidobacterium amazonense]